MITVRDAFLCGVWFDLASECAMPLEGESKGEYSDADMFLRFCLGLRRKFDKCETLHDVK